MALEQDSNGFLVGTVITDIKRSRKNSDQLLIEVKKIAALLKKEGHLQAGNSDNALTNASANAGSQQRSRRQNQRNNSGGSSNSSQSESSNSTSSELNENSEQPAQQRHESLRQKRERQRRERQQQRLSQQEQQADTQADSQQADLTQNPPPDNNSDGESSSNGNARQRDARGRFTSEADNSGPEPITAGGDDATRGRDSRGRFAGGGSGSNGGNTDLEKDGDGNGGLGGLIGGLGDRITTAITAGQELQEVDPTIKAFQEVAEPLQRGYQFIFAGSSKKDKPYFAWFGKLWNTLKSINKNTAEDSGGENGDSGGGLMGILTAIATAAIVAWGLFSKDGKALFSKIGELFAPIGQWVSDALSPISKQVAAVLLPIGAVLLAVFTPLGSMLLSGIWAVLSPIGGLIVSGLGAALSGIGSLIVAGIGLVFSPIGLAIIAAGTLAWGLFTEDGRAFFANIGGFIADSWNRGLELFANTFPEFTASAIATWESIKSGFDPVIKTANDIFNWLKAKWDSVIGFVSQIFESFSNFMKDKFGIDIPVAIDNVVAKASEIVQPAVEQAEKAKQAVTDFSESAKKSASEATDTVKDFTAKMWDNAKGIGGAIAGEIGNVAGKIGNSIIGTANASEGGDMPSRVSESSFGKHKQASEMLQSLGMKQYEARGLATNIMAESSMNPMSVGDGGEAYGLMQWHPDRQAKYTKLMGHTMQSVTDKDMALKEQLKFAHWEMTQDPYESKNFARASSESGGNSAKMAGLVSRYNERPKAVEEAARNRANQGAGYEKQYGSFVSPQIASATPKKEIMATPEQIQNAMPKAVQPVSAMPSIASISTIPSVMNQSAKMPEMPNLVLPLSNNVKSAPTTIIPDVGQTVSDQHIAQIAYPYATSMGNNKG